MQNFVAFSDYMNICILAFSRGVLTADFSNLVESAVKTHPEKSSWHEKYNWLKINGLYCLIGTTGTLFCVEIWLSKNELENAFYLLVIEPGSCWERIRAWCLFFFRSLFMKKLRSFYDVISYSHFIHNHICKGMNVLNS